MTHSHIKILLLCSLGGFLEFFDFMIFALLSSEISQVFFPHQSEMNALFATFSTFAIGYLARPLGGIIFGHFGDKYGRKRTFTLSILIMAFSTLSIGLIPSYHSIGILAPSILIILRLLQGLSIGGEIPGAITYISEYWTEKKGIAIGVIFCFLLSGISVGLVIKEVLSYFYSQQEIIEWVWRLPFFIGGIFGCVAYFLRKKLIEIPTFSPYVLKETRFPIIAIFKKQKRTFFFAALLMSCGGIPLTTLFIFLPTYLTSILHQTNSNFSLVNAVSILFASLSCILVGWMSDRISRITILIIFSIASLLLPLPIFMIYNSNMNYFPLAIGMSSLLVGLALGNCPAMLSELFESEIRYSGVGLSYNIGVGIVGGITPLMILSSITYFDTVMAPAFILIINAIVILFMLAFYRIFLKKESSHIFNL